MQQRINFPQQSQVSDIYGSRDVWSNSHSMGPDATQRRIAGLPAEQFDANMKLREQLLGFLGIGNNNNNGGQPGQGGPAQTFNPYFESARDSLTGARDQQMGLLENYGQSKRAQLSRDLDSSRGRVGAQLESRGLGASNLVGAAASAVDEGYQQSLLGLEDMLLGRKTDIVGDTGSQVSGTYVDQAGMNANLINQILGRLV